MVMMGSNKGQFYLFKIKFSHVWRVGSSSSVSLIIFEITYYSLKPSVLTRYPRIAFYMSFPEYFSKKLSFPSVKNGVLRLVTGMLIGTGLVTFFWVSLVHVGICMYTSTYMYMCVYSMCVYTFS